MSIVTGYWRGTLGRSRALLPILGLVALVGCETFQENPSPNPSTVSAQDLESQPYPNLSQVPDKPPPVTPEQIRASTAAGLEADRANAQYTAPLTASGTSVQAAAPPQPTPTAPTTASATTASTTTAAPSTAAPSAAAVTAAAPPASTPSPEEAATAVGTAATGAAATGGAPTSLDQTTTAVAAAGVPNQVTGRVSTPPATSGSAPSAAAAQAASPYTGGAAVAGSTATPAAATSAATTTAAATIPQGGTGGTPSASQTPGAAALATSRRQRRSGTAVATAPTPTTVSSTGVTGAPIPTTTAALPQQQPGLPLGPGPGASAAAAAAAAPMVPTQGTVGSGAVQLVAVIYFSNASAALDGRDIAVLREVAAIQRQYGGIIRVIGHASSRTAVLPQERHQLVNLQVSFDRAESVGQALLRAGLPQTALVMEGVSDRQPVYHEFMVTGEAGNRRAEIFLEY